MRPRNASSFRLAVDLLSSVSHDTYTYMNLSISRRFLSFLHSSFAGRCERYLTGIQTDELDVKEKHAEYQQQLYPRHRQVGMLFDHSRDSKDVLSLHVINK